MPQTSKLQNNTKLELHRGYSNVFVQYVFYFTSEVDNIYILKAKSNFTLLFYIPFLGIGEWYFKCV